MYNTRASVSCVSLLLSITTQKLALTGSPVKPGGGWVSMRASQKQV